MGSNGSPIQFGGGRSGTPSSLAKTPTPMDRRPSAPVPTKAAPDTYLATIIQPAQSRKIEKDFSISIGKKALKIHAQIYLPKQSQPNTQTFVLVHGFQANGAAFSRLAPRLQREGHRVYAIDLPGHGKSERPEWFPYSDPDAYAQALLRFLDKANLEKVHLVGHSMGGGISTHFALKHPEKLSKLTLLSPWSQDIAISSFGKAVPWLTCLFLGMTPTLNMKRGLRNTSWDRSWSRDNQNMARLTAPIHLENPDVSFPALLQKTVEMDWSKLQKTLTANKIARLRKQVGTVNIFYGEKDPLIPAGDVEDLNKKLGGKLIIVENVGHVLPSEAPELAPFISGKKTFPHVIVHHRQDDIDLPSDSYRGPYFQGGLRGAFQSDLDPGNYQTLGQFFLNVDHDHPGHLQPGLEFGIQGMKSFERIDWNTSGYFQPKFYWFRTTWFEAATGIMPLGGVGRFQRESVMPFFALDAQLVKAELNLMNSGFLLFFYSALNTNLVSTELPAERNFVERSNFNLGLGGAI